MAAKANAVYLALHHGHTVIHHDGLRSC